MDLNIAGAIRRLRRERDITQEELASAIGVTAQAVSKWERAEGYPDITLLPKLADYFNVTLDNLCGIDEQRDASEICRIHSATMFAQSYDDGVRIAREGLAKYPYSYRLKENLAFALKGCLGRWTPPKETLREIIALYEDILEHCLDQELRNSVASDICQIYALAGEQKKAEEAAWKLPVFFAGRELALARVLRGETRVMEIQNACLQFLPCLDGMLHCAMEEEHYSADEKIQLCRKMIAMYEIVGDCHDWPVGLIFSMKLYLRIAEYALELGDRDSCFEALTQGQKLAAEHDALVLGDHLHSLMLNLIPKEAVEGAPDCRDFMMEELQEIPAFDPIRKTPEFAAILAGLTNE